MIQKGLGVVFGVDNVTITGAIVSATTGALLQSLDQVRGAEVAYAKDYIGNTRSAVFFDPNRKLSISVIPSGTSVAAALASLDAWVPASGGTATIAADGAFIDGANGGKYNILSARAAETNTGIAVVTLELEAFEANDVTLLVA